MTAPQTPSFRTGHAAALAELASARLGDGPTFQVDPAAPCVALSADPEKWHPAVGPSSESLREARYARKQCWGCPQTTKAECLGYAIRNEQDGIWGGTTARDRSALRRRRSPLLVIVEEVLAGQEAAAQAEAERAAALAGAGSGYRRRGASLPPAASDS